MPKLFSKKKELDLSGAPRVMGVLNITPDSFSDGGLYYENGAAATAAALSRAHAMIAEGADIIDIGGESTRPGSEGISAAEEIARVLPVIREIRGHIPDEIWISVDTDKAEVAEAALAAGADMINVLGGVSKNPAILEVAKKYNCPIAVYHIRGTPKTMQTGEILCGDVVAEVKKFFLEEIEVCERAGDARARVILDPGIGFGKTVEQNVSLIKHIGEFAGLGSPVLIGVSRKSHLGAILKEELNLAEVPGPLERVEAGLAETAVAVANGARLVRTHDVGATKKFLATLNYLERHG